MVAVINTAQTHKQLVAEGVEPVGSTPEHLAGYLRSEMAKWAKVVKAAGIQAQ